MVGNLDVVKIAQHLHILSSQIRGCLNDRNRLSVKSLAKKIVYIVSLLLVVTVNLWLVVTVNIWLFVTVNLLLVVTVRLIVLLMRTSLKLAQPTKVMISCQCQFYANISPKVLATNIGDFWALCTYSFVLINCLLKKNENYFSQKNGEKPKNFITCVPGF
jgi:hypothetical protein